MAGARIAERLELGDHLCSFVDGADDRLDVMAQTAAAGLEAGDRVLLFADALSPAAVVGGLAARGVAVSAAQDAGQVHVLPARDAYLPTGRFEASRMLHDLAGHIDDARRDGYRGLRVVGDMTWALAEPAGADELAGYEAHVNRLFVHGRSLAICLYDRHAFSPDLLRRVARAHPASTCGDAETGWEPLLRIRRTTNPYGLRLTGESDLSNREALSAVFDAVLAEQPDPGVPITLDVTALRFADAGTGALLGRLASRAPAGVHLTEPHPVLATILDQLGLTRLPELRLPRTSSDLRAVVGA